MSLPPHFHFLSRQLKSPHPMIPCRAENLDKHTQEKHKLSPPIITVAFKECGAELLKHTTASNTFMFASHVTKNAIRKWSTYRTIDQRNTVVRKDILCFFINEGMNCKSPSHFSYKSPLHFSCNYSKVDFH